MTATPVLVFDMDGVLVDVHDSYRETIRETVLFFTRQEVSHETIQDYKNRGGFNNDWILSHTLCKDLGVPVPYDAVVAKFQELFFGTSATPGLILREKWIPRDGLMDRLASRHPLSIFTGRYADEARVTLDRFAPHLRFDPLMAEDCVTVPKPHPDGLLRIANRYPDRPLLYVGDSVDDARAASAAGVAFVGIAAPANPRHRDLVTLLQAENAVAILDDINQLEAAIPA